MKTLRGPIARHAYIHRKPCLVSQEKAWTDISHNSILLAKAEAQSLRLAWRKFQDRLEQFRSIVRWMKSEEEAHLTFQAACDNAGVPPDTIREAILRTTSLELRDFLAGSHRCPLCLQPRKIP